MIKKDIVEDVEQEEASLIRPPPVEFKPEPTEAPKAEVTEEIPSEFLVKSEQKRMKKKEKMKKFKDLLKNHKKVLKQMDDDEKKNLDKARKNALRIAQEFEYEDEYDDVVLEKQVSLPANDITAGKENNNNF